MRSFWAGLLAALVGASSLLHFWWSPTGRSLPEPPPFWPVSKTAYLAATNAGSAAHCLSLYGFLGVGKRMREADLVLIGTSHVAFGLSAELLSKELSASLGRPVRVYNAGLGYIEGWGFISQMLRRAHIEDKALLIDLFERGEGISEWGKLVSSENPLKGAVRVGDIWLSYLEGGLFYRFIPHFSIAAPKFLASTPFLDGRCWFQNLETGDTYGVWQPSLGMVYSLARYRVDPSDPNDKIASADAEARMGNMIAETEDVIRANRLRPIFTLIPFSGYAPQAAAMAARAANRPFVLLLPDGLETWDRGHLVSESRTVATERLFLQMKDKKLDALVGETRP